jgi:hypothetical protein
MVMTKSKGVGRGGVRAGAGRRPKTSTVDWDAIGRAYYTGNESIEDICKKFDIGYGDLLAHAAGSHWMMRRPTRSHPDDLGSLASSLAAAMWSVDHKPDRSKRFVAAMVALDEHEIEIAEALNIPLETLQRDFKKELGARW